MFENIESNGSHHAKGMRIDVEFQIKATQNNVIKIAASFQKDTRRRHQKGARKTSNAGDKIVDQFPSLFDVMLLPHYLSFEITMLFTHILIFGIEFW